MEKSFFFDTYAFFEITKDSDSYKQYGSENTGIVTTRMNLMELHYGILKEKNLDVADKLYDELIGFVVEITDQDIKKANELKLKHKKNKLSYIDCLGYAISRRLGMKFLTGDDGFKDMENVEFVK